MKTKSTLNLGTLIFLGFAVILNFIFSPVVGQKINFNRVSSKSSDSSNIARAEYETPTDEKKKHPLNDEKEVKTYNSTSHHHSPLSTHKIFHHRTPATLKADQLVTGNTYNRYGEKTFPKGYGIQVMTFKKIKNLQRFLHTYHKKDMYIQVVKFDTTPEQMYRVILGAEENKNLIEQEISVFQNAGVQAVVRKHKTLSE